MHRVLPSLCVGSVTLAFSTALAGGLAIGACSGVSSPRGVVVELERIADTAPARWWGMTNIFFDSVPPEIRDSVRLGEGWTSVELADVVRGEGLVTVYAARFKAPSSTGIHYVVDTDGDLDFKNERPLTFHRRRGVAIADLDIEVRTASGTRRRVPYQVLLSDDGYTYARIAEYRAGRARLGGRDYAVRLRNASRNHPFYGPDDGTVFLIERDGDGSIAEQAGVTLRGRASSAEEVVPGTPFVLAGQPYEVAEVDSGGSRLVLRPSVVRVAAAAGFDAPDLTARRLSGANYRLADDRGKVVLVEFWSVDCHYSEVARSALNDLAARVSGGLFRWLALARENDSSAIGRHLVDHPMRATVALYDSTAWRLYNPAVATPLFFVVDQHGVVRFRGLGASAVDAVAAKVVELLRRG